MRKLKLDPNDLRVESFATRDGHPLQPGTVHGHDLTPLQSGFRESTGGCICACDTLDTAQFPVCGDISQECT